MKKKILEADWLSHPSIHFLSTVFQKSGYEILFVGGCIRNTILKKQVNDVDIATVATPEEIIKICKKSNIKANILNPGPTRTTMRPIAYPGEIPEEIKPPEEVTEYFLQLAETSCHLNGEIIQVEELQCLKTKK